MNPVYSDRAVIASMLACFIRHQQAALIECEALLRDVETFSHQQKEQFLVDIRSNLAHDAPIQVECRDDAFSVARRLTNDDAADEWKSGRLVYDREMARGE